MSSELTEKARALADAWALDKSPDSLTGADHFAEARTLVPALCDENDALHKALEAEERSANRWYLAHEGQAARIRELEDALRRAKGFGQEKIG